MVYKTKKESDHDLIEKALQGNQAAYTKLFNRYKGMLSFSIRNIVRDRDVAADVMMETFERAFHNLDRYQLKFAFSTWIYRIGFNLAIDHVRKSGRVTMYRVDQPDDDESGNKRAQLQLPDGDPLPNENYHTSQKQHMVRDVIRALPLPHRQFLQLRYVDGFSYDEIADEMGIPVGTVKGSLHRARELACEYMVRNNLLDTLND